MANMNADGVAINSGFCSGNKYESITNVSCASEVCKGTVWSYLGTIDLVKWLQRRPLNSGAHSGDSGARSGTVNSDRVPSGAYLVYSKNIGTYRSFNIGYEPSDNKRFTAIDREVVKEIDGKDKLFEKRSYGTRGSFNVKGGDSMIDARDATINSGCGAGNNAYVNDYLSSVINPYRYEYGGTTNSFNAVSGRQINIKRATLNTGAFAGIRY